MTINLPASLTCSFYGYEMPLEEANIIIFGVPFYTTSFGAKPPLPATYFLRIVSEYVEDSSMISSKYYSELKIVDIGDLTSSTNDDIETDIYTILEYASKKDKSFLMVGGAHTYTYYTVKYSKPDLLLVLDAHLDMKKRYMGSDFNNATFLRRIVEDELVEKVIIIGARGFEEDEYAFAEENDVEVIDWREKELDIFLEISKGFKKIYLSVDLDHLDPLYMPHVSYPEPIGMSPSETFNILKSLYEMDGHVIGGDLMEYVPYTLNISPGIIASKILLEIAVLLEKKM